MQQFGLSKVKNRQLPYLSQECESHWINHCQDMHKRNLKRVKPAIDNKWGGKKNGVTDPKMPKYPHLSSNAARARREDGEAAQSTPARRARPRSASRWPRGGSRARARTRPIAPPRRATGRRAVARGGEREPAPAE